MRTARSFAAVAFAFSVFMSLMSPGRASANPAANGWAKFGVGSSVTMSGETTAGGQKTASTMKTTLVEKGKDSVTVEIAITMNVAGQTITPAATKQVIPNAAGANGTAVQPGMKETGEETLTIAGKEVKCKVYEVTTEVGGQKSISNIWMSDAIPGGTAKTVAKSAAVEVTYTVTAFEAK